MQLSSQYIKRFFVGKKKKKKEKLFNTTFFFPKHKTLLPSEEQIHYKNYTGSGHPKLFINMNQHGPSAEHDKRKRSCVVPLETTKNPPRRSILL